MPDRDSSTIGTSQALIDLLKLKVTSPR